MTVRQMSQEDAKVASGGAYRKFAKAFGWYIATLSIKLIYVGIVLARRRDAWVVGDWEINYAGGFVRRGLLGEGIRKGARLLHAPRTAIILVVQWSCYATIFWSVWSLLRGMRWSLWMVLLVYSPATLSFTLLSINRAMHKEILFLALLSISSASGLRSGLLYWFPWALAAVVLTHEGLAVYLPYVVCNLYLASRSMTAATLTVLPSLAALYLSVSHPGTISQALAICRSVGGQDLDSPVCSGAIKYLACSRAQAHEDTAASFRHFRLWMQAPFMAAMATFPLALAMRNLWVARQSESKCVVACSSISWLASLSLFWYSMDWDRWIYVHTFSSMLVLLPIERRRQELV